MIEDVRNKDFENGRKLQRLETQMSSLYSEIYLNGGKNNPKNRERLRGIVREVFPEYLTLAIEYKVHPAEIRKLTETYYKAMGEKSRGKGLANCRI